MYEYFDIKTRDCLINFEEAFYKSFFYKRDESYLEKIHSDRFQAGYKKQKHIYLAMISLDWLLEIKWI